MVFFWGLKRRGDCDIDNKGKDWKNLGFFLIF